MRKSVLLILAAAIGLGTTACSGTREKEASLPHPTGISFQDIEGRNKLIEELPVAEGFLDGVRRFSAVSASSVLRGSSGNINYSPYSLYMALSLAASGAEGQTRKEMLAVLEAKGKDNRYLSKQAGNLLRQLHTDNEVGQLQTANSVWLKKGQAFTDSFKEGATGDFIASLYEVDFTDSETGSLMSQWISDRTRGLLSPRLETDPRQIMSILSTLYYQDEWGNRFDESKTEPGPFYPAPGVETTVDYMNRTHVAYGYTRGEGFTSSSLGLKNGGSFTFILPDRGVSVDELISSPDRVEQLFQPAASFGKVIFQIPKFSFGSELQLAEQLQSLGMKSAFGLKADFSGMTQDQAFISSLQQQTRISIDEKGVEAAAFTRLDYAGSGAPDGNIAEMIMDRPFVYGITSRNGVLLFVGICRNPQIQ